MAITLNDLKERLEASLDEIEKRNYGNAAQRLANTIQIIERSGVIIHAISTTENKKVESNGSNEEE